MTLVDGGSCCFEVIFSLHTNPPTAKPGFVTLYDNSDPQRPKFFKAIPAAAGAHHTVLSPDERYLFVRTVS